MNAEQQVLIPGIRRPQASARKQYWLTPPDFYQALNDEFGFDFDPCPYPLPDGFNGLTREWGRVNYVNPPFRPCDVIEGSGPTAFARKAVEQAANGKTSVLMLPVRSYTDLLIRAGAEIRAVGRLPWLDTETHEPVPNPGVVALFILRGYSQEASG